MQNIIRMLLLVFALGFNLTAILAPLPLGDLGSFIASGQAATQGQNPYGIYPLTNVGRSINGDVAYGINLNPPFLLPAFEALAQLEPKVAPYLWASISCILYAITLILLARQYPECPRWQLGWAWTLAGLWFTLVLGQLYVWLALIVTSAWIFLQNDREKDAALLIGLLVAIKPNFILWPLFLGLAGHRRLATIAIASFIAWSLLPVARYGFSVYGEWLAVLPTAPGIGRPINPSLVSLTARIGHAWLGSLLSLALLGALATWVWRCKLDILNVSTLALVATLLFSPVVWIGYTLLLLPAFLSQPWSRLLNIAAILLAVPVFFVLAIDQLAPTPFNGLAWIYTMALALVLIELIMPHSCASRTLYKLYLRLNPQIKAR